MFNYRFILISALFYMVGCGSDSPSKNHYETNDDTVGVIYGEDSVKNVFSSVPNSKLSVAFIPKDTFSRFIQRESVETVEDIIGSVAGIKWLQDPSLAICSGVLIDDDLVLTAGHCFEGEGSCENLSIVFGFEASPSVFDTMKAVECKEVIRHNNDLMGKGLDYALVRLASKVYLPNVKISEREVEIGEEVYTLGYPLGSPKKRADGKIRQVIPMPGVFNASLDVFQGNSGSPVFSSKTHELIGIISSGESDFDDLTDAENEDSQPNNEASVKHCADDECLGEIIIPIQKILADISGKNLNSGYK